MRKHSHYLRSGFTMVEIMVVIMVIGVMSGMGMLSFRKILQRRRVDQASSRLTFQLQYARSEAIAINKMARVTLNDSTNVFQLWFDEDGDDTLDTGEVDTEIVIASPDQVTMNTEWTTGMFNAFGQFILTPGQREIKTVSTTFKTDNSEYEVELILRGSGAVTKR